MDRTAEGLSTERARPGAATLAHCGVLCLDDIDDFCANDVEQLARTAEMKRTDDRHGAMPADFLLVATLTVPPDPQSRNGGASGLDAETARTTRDRLPVSRTFQIAARVEGTTLWAAHNRVAGGDVGYGRRTRPARARRSGRTLWRPRRAERQRTAPRADRTGGADPKRRSRGGTHRRPLRQRAADARDPPRAHHRGSGRPCRGPVRRPYRKRRCSARC